VSPHAWIFDLDGTLTVPMHDFAGFKRSVGLPLELDILTGIAQRPASEQAELHRAVKAWETSLVDGAKAADGAEELLASLSGPVGIVTRNTREGALRTLEVIGLARWFPEDAVLGRTCAEPKPSPEPVQRLLGQWQVAPGRAVMVGDYVDDLRAGKAAGTSTVWVDHVGAEPPVEADRVVRSLRELL
jgi:HAD superfamily hydrolase (TIGR01509 family)